MIISLDSETSGLDLYAGAAPYLVTVCRDNGSQDWWEVDVNPLDREPNWLPEEVEQIRREIARADEIVFHNAKFDITALGVIGVNEWDWSKTQDTLLAAHLVGSNQPRNLTDLAVAWLGVDIEPLEVALCEACNKARRWCRTNRKEWRIAKQGLEEMPSAKSGGKGTDGKLWKADGWLPRAICVDQERPDDDPLWTVLSDYANADSSTTLMLWQALSQEVQRRGLWEIYLERRKLLPIAFRMERGGVTASGERHEEMEERLRAESESAAATCVRLAAGMGYELDLPRSGNNGSLSKFCFGEETTCTVCEGMVNTKDGICKACFGRGYNKVEWLKLPVLKASEKTGAPSLDKEVMEQYEHTLDTSSKQGVFIRKLSAKRKCDTALGFLESYRKFRLPLNESAPLSLKIISGGQNGVDQAALRAAKASGFPTGGTAPKGYRTLDGSMPELGDIYGLGESYSPGYPPRTQDNVADSDATLQVYEDCSSPGEVCTLNAVRACRKPLMQVPLGHVGPEQAAQWIKDNGWSVLNIAGNSERTSPGIGGRAERFLLEVFSKLRKGIPENLWFLMHPNLNICGTDTLRMSSSNPNSQQISKRENYNLRGVFGPAPGREWWSLDYKNVELRIPYYLSGEQELVALFERPDDPPYYGSNHLLNFHTVYPELWEKALSKFGPEKVGEWIKSKEGYKASWYQWCKNGGFAIQYQAQEATADRSFRVNGAFRKLKSRFRKMDAYNKKWVDYAQKHGYVETVPDRTVNPLKGYPVLCSRSESGRILPTVPLNYHVQSTAMWLTSKAMVRVHEQLDEWNRTDRFDGRIALQVHDELVLDLPKRADPRTDLDPKRADGMKLFRRSNLWRVRVVQKLMEQGGMDLVTPVPTPVGVEWHETSWDTGVTL